MALTWGVNGKHPCPVCLVPNAEKSCLDQSYPLWTAEESKVLVIKALKEKGAARQDQITKVQSLWPVIV